MNKFLPLFCLYILFPCAALASGHIKYSVIGVNAVIAKNIMTRLETEQKLIGTDPTTADVNEFYKNSKVMVHNAITPYGYFSPVIESKINKTQSDWVLTYKVQLGKPVIIKEVNVSATGPGNDNFNIQMYMTDFPLKSGTIYTAEAYETAKARLLEIANNQGYMKADYTESNVLVNTSTLNAIVNLKLETNERYYFGKLIFNKSPYSEAFLQRFNIFKSKQPFSSNSLIDYQQSMNDSRYFSQVLVIPDLEHITPDRHVPVHVSVSTAKAHRYTLGIGYGTFTGPRFTAGTLFRHLTNTGQSLDAQLKVSKVLTGLAAKYYIPGSNPLSDQWMLGTSYQRFQPKSGWSSSRSIMGGYNYKSDRWQWSANLNYLLERYKLDDSILPPTDTEILYPSFDVSYVKADDLISPKTARSFSINLQGSSQNLLSSTSFLQSEVKTKLFFTPYTSGHIVLSGDFGYTVVHNITDLPLSLRFFAGGITSLRGYPDSSIGPGKYLGTGMLEYRQHVTENWAGAIFFDAGTATNHFGDPINEGTGLGVIYESPVGPIRLYLARALTKADHPYQVEFNIGPEF